MPTDLKIYLCGGNPKCFGKCGCGLCGRGECYATTDIQCARNKYVLINGKGEYDRLAVAVRIPHIVKEQEHE